MKELSLSIEELIYCFYSEGYFEQGNAFKQIYFPELSDENMDILLQATCRSLLAKGVLNYENHKFTLTNEVSEVISALNYSERSYKASRHTRGSGEESLSLHINKGLFIQHTLHFDDQVHTLKLMSKEEAVSRLADFFRFGDDESKRNRFKLSREDFEGLLELIDQQIYHSPDLSEQQASFMEVLGQGDGLLNTFILMEFNDNREAEAKEIVLFTNREKDNWIIEQDDQAFFAGGWQSISH